MAFVCPQCNHEDTRPRGRARKVGSVLGAIAGAAPGIAGIVSAARSGMLVGKPGPTLGRFTAIAAAILAGLAGAGAGFDLGGSLGTLFDRHVLDDNGTCRNCGYPSAVTDDLPHPGPQHYGRRWGDPFAGFAGQDDVTDVEDPEDPDGSTPPGSNLPAPI